eukprot:COSAG05_NODE_1067_length_5971_cov_450.254257_8_plen_60_part_00
MNIFKEVLRHRDNTKTLAEQRLTQRKLEREKRMEKLRRRLHSSSQVAPTPRPPYQSWTP